MLSFMVFSILYARLFSGHSIHKFTSYAEPAQLWLKCMCFTFYIYVQYECLCVWQRGSGALQKLMPREADKERLDHREAENESSYLGKPHIHTPALHRRCRATHMSHFIGRHQLMSTHEDESTHPPGLVHTLMYVWM